MNGYSASTVLMSLKASECLTTHSHSQPPIHNQSVGRSVGQSVKFLLVFTSTVIPGFSLLEICDQDFYSLLDTYMF
jgi:hypothetical protein